MNAYMQGLAALDGGSQVVSNRPSASRLTVGSTSLSQYSGGRVVGSGASQVSVVGGLNIPGNTLSGETITHQVTQNNNRLFEPDFTTGLAAAGSYMEALLGPVWDIIDISAVAIVSQLIDVKTPTGEIMDLVYLTRTKSQEAFIRMIPGGLWRFINVSGAAIVGKVIGMSHTAPPNQLTV